MVADLTKPIDYVDMGQTTFIVTPVSLWKRQYHMSFYRVAVDAGNLTPLCCAAGP